MELSRQLKGKELSAFLVKKLDELADNICQDADELESFVKRWNNGFHSYSLNNVILAWVQRPDFTLLAGYKSWLDKGRKVKSGERCVRILAPMAKKVINVSDDGNEEEVILIKGFKPVPVFDISQTDGDPVDVGCPDLISGYVDFERIAKACPFPVKIKDLGLSNGNTDGKTINITPKKNKASQCATLVHEWSHILLSHCDSSKTLFETEEQSVKEIEAETCSFIVCSAIGISNRKSRLYVGSWGGNKAELQNRGKKILSVAEKIVRSIANEVN